MAITEAHYANEAELDGWVAQNITSFLSDSIYLPGFQVSTVSGKSGVPDGFAFNLKEQEWFVIEAELLSHGVWPHIAEQIVRFIVATQNPQTRRRIRDAKAIGKHPGRKVKPLQGSPAKAGDALRCWTHSTVGQRGYNGYSHAI